MRPLKTTKELRAQWVGDAYDLRPTITQAIHDLSHDVDVLEDESVWLRKTVSAWAEWMTSEEMLSGPKWERCMRLMDMTAPPEEGD